MPLSTPHIIVMGVSACGKSRVAKAMSATLGRPFIEGDDLHPPSNIRMMEQGRPLTDDDRRPWLHRIAQAMNASEQPAVATCSALKRTYRNLLRKETARPLFFLHLSAPREVLLPRMEHRQNHFMPSALLDSQFADLDPLSLDEPGLTVDVTPPVEDVIGNAISAYRAVARDRHCQV